MKNDPNLAPQDQPYDAPADQLDRSNEPSRDPLLDVSSTDTNDSLVSPAATEAPQPIETVKAPQSKKRLAILISSIVVAVLLLIGGGAALAYNLWYQNPDKVIGDALMNLASAESATVNGTLSGSSDGTTVDLTVATRLNTSGGQGTVDGSIETETGSVDLTAELISVSGADLYVKLDNTQETASQLFAASGVPVDVAGLADFFNGLDGQWIRVSSDELGTVDEDAAKVQECLATLEGKIKQDRTLLDEVGASYRNNLFIVVDERLGDRVVEGVDSLGYRISIDVESYNSFIGAFEATALYDEIKACNEDLDLADARLEADDVQDTTIEVWISRWSHELTELSLTSTDETAPASLKVNTSFEATEEVVAPADSKTIQEVYEELINAFTADTQEA